MESFRALLAHGHQNHILEGREILAELLAAHGKLGCVLGRLACVLLAAPGWDAAATLENLHRSSVDGFEGWDVLQQQQPELMVAALWAGAPLFSQELAGYVLGELKAVKEVVRTPEYPMALNQWTRFEQWQNGMLDGADEEFEAFGCYAEAISRIAFVNPGDILALNKEDFMIVHEALQLFSHIFPTQHDVHDESVAWAAWVVKSNGYPCPP